MKFNKASYKKTWVPHSFLNENLDFKKFSLRKLKFHKYLFKKC